LRIAYNVFFTHYEIRNTLQEARMGQYKRIFLALLTIIGLSACQSGPPPFKCTDAIGCVTIGPEAPVEIGVIQALSGEVATLGVDQVRGLELALAEREGQLLGHPVQLHSEDDLCSREGGAVAAEKLKSMPQVVAIFGTTCSGAAVPAAKILSEAGLTMISGGNTAPSLTSVNGQVGADWQPGYFRTAHNDANQGRAAATFVFQELGLRKAATINDGDVYTQGLTDVFGQVFTELGGDIVLATAINKGDTDMKPVLEAVVASGAQLLFFPLFEPESHFIALQAKEIEGLARMDLMTGEGSLTSTFVEAVGSSGAGVYFVSPATPESADYQTFVANYQATYGQAPGSPLLGGAYDAANLLLDTLEQVAIREEGGTLHLGRQALRDALYATAGYEGLTGSLTCDKFGDCGPARFKVVRLDDPTTGFESLADNVVYTYNSGE
jgi:branched-chain amino acid transport system substrate-binding protein